jgi:hypothetical protein
MVFAVKNAEECCLAVPVSPYESQALTLVYIKAYAAE